MGHSIREDDFIDFGRKKKDLKTINKVACVISLVATCEILFILYKINEHLQLF